MVRGHHSFLSSFSALLCVLLHLCHQWLDSFPFDKHDLTTLPPPRPCCLLRFLVGVLLFILPTFAYVRSRGWGAPGGADVSLGKEGAGFVGEAARNEADW